MTSTFADSWRRTAVILVAGAVASLLATRAVAAQSTEAEPDAMSYLVMDYRETLSSLDSASVAFRQAVGLPWVRPEDIVAVTDSTVLRRAARAYYRLTLGPASHHSAAVIRAGDYYLVFGTERAGEWSIVEVLDGNFDEVASLAR